MHYRESPAPTRMIDVYERLFIFIRLFNCCNKESIKITYFFFVVKQIMNFLRIISVMMKVQLYQVLYKAEYCCSTNAEEPFTNLVYFILFFIIFLYIFF